MKFTIPVSKIKDFIEVVFGPNCWLPADGSYIIPHSVKQMTITYMFNGNYKIEVFRK